MPTQRLSITDAAAHFAVHPTTIRRRIVRGELQAERENDEPNAKVFVLVDAPDENPAQTDGAQAAHTDASAVRTRLEDEVQWLREELEARRREVERLQTLMAQQGAAVQALTQRVEQLPASAQAQMPARDHLIHTYLSQLVQFLPLLFTPLIGGAVFVWSTVKLVSHTSTSADKASFGLSLAALVSLVALRWLPKPLAPAADPADRLRDLRSAALFVLFYLLGAILTVVSIVVAVLA